MKWFLRALYLLVALLVVALGVRFWFLQKAYDTAPQTLAGMSYGPADADITIVEFLDYRCAACRDAHPVVQQAIAEFPDIRFTFRHLPVFGQPSIVDAQIALTAARHGHFTAAHELLISRENPMSEDDIAAFATSIGQDPALFREEMRQPANAEIFYETLKIAEILKIAQTPAFLINKNIFYPTTGPLTIEDLRAAINAVRTP